MQALVSSGSFSPDHFTSGDVQPSELCSQPVPRRCTARAGKQILSSSVITMVSIFFPFCLPCDLASSEQPRTFATSSDFPSMFFIPLSNPSLHIQASRASPLHLPPALRPPCLSLYMRIYSFEGKTYMQLFQYLISKRSVCLIPSYVTFLFTRVSSHPLACAAVPALEP